VAGFLPHPTYICFKYGTEYGLLNAVKVLLRHRQQTTYRLEVQAVCFTGMHLELMEQGRMCPGKLLLADLVSSPEAASLVRSGLSTACGGVSVLL